MLFFCVLLIRLLLCGLCSEDIVWPKDTEATEGSDVVLNCISPTVRSFEWHHLPYGSSSPEISHRDGACLNGYCARGYSLLKNTPGEYSIHISKASIEDAGKHRCVLSGDQREAELDVLVRYPSKETCSGQFPTDGVIGHNQCQLEPDLIKLSCSLKYVGNLEADLEWIQIAGGYVNIYTTNASLNGTTISTLQLKDGQLQDATFVCRIRYLSSNLSSLYSCSFRITTIPLRLRSVTVDSELGLQQINCSSDLPYKCSYSWMYEGTEVSSSQMLNLIEPKSGKYTCHATCTVRGRSCTFKSHEVTYQQNANKSQPAETNNTGMIVGIVVLFVAVVAVVAVVIYLKIRRIACFTKRQPVSGEQGIDRDGSPASKMSVPLQQPDENKGEGDKLLKENFDREPVGIIDQNGHVLRYDDENEANLADIINHSPDYNVLLRNKNKNSTDETGNTAGH